MNRINAFAASPDDPSKLNKTVPAEIHVSGAETSARVGGTRRHMQSSVHHQLRTSRPDEMKAHTPPIFLSEKCVFLPTQTTWPAACFNKTPLRGGVIQGCKKNSNWLRNRRPIRQTKKSCAIARPNQQSPVSLLKNAANMWSTQHHNLRN